MGSIDDRRTTTGDFRGRPRSSPVNVLILTVAGTLVVMAFATVLLGGAMEEETPHGQLLSAVQRAADAQEAHHAREGTFTRWASSLDVRTADGVTLSVIWADVSGWEVIASHEVGLSCMQRGTATHGQLRREPPACFMEQR